MDIPEKNLATLGTQDSTRRQTKQTNTSKGAIRNGQCRETDNIRYTRRRKTKQRHDKICVGHHCTQTDTNKVNKT
jgi:hypothetical protein